MVDPAEPPTNVVEFSTDPLALDLGREQQRVELVAGVDRVGRHQSGS